MAINRQWIVGGLLAAGGFAAASALLRKPVLEGRGARLELSRGLDGNPDLGSVFFVGTATTILRIAGFTILTDPNFLHAGDHIHVGYGIFTRRITNPAIEIEDLPPLDLVLVSHMHADHFDRVALEKLDRAVPLVTTRHASRRLTAAGFRLPFALGKWDSMSFVKEDVHLRITAMPGRHGPGPIAAALPPVMGFMLEFEDVNGDRLLRMYISGDTLMHDEIREIPKRFADVDLALLHLGGTTVLGVMQVTMDGRQGVEMMRVVAPHAAIPIHYDDYTLFKSPLSDFQRAVRDAGLEDRVVYLDRGQSHEFKLRKNAVEQPLLRPATVEERSRI